MLRSGALLVCLLSALPSFAGQFEPVPAEPNGTPSGLQLRVVKYEGATNGALTVQVKNPTAAPVAFSALGLFFVPAVNPDEAPQRLGAVGSMLRKGQATRAESLTLAPGQTEELTLDVYCIDSHRPSPTSTTPFRVGKERMPRELSQGINANAQQATKAMGSVHAAPAKSTVQSEVWKTRNEKWIKLDGEGQQEATK